MALGTVSVFEDNHRAAPDAFHGSLARIPISSAMRARRTIAGASAATLLLLLEAGCGGRTVLEAAGANPSSGEDAAAPCKGGLDDAHNCGACGHDCLGGACAAGTCQPVDIASEQGLPAGIVVDKTNLYWVNLGTAIVPSKGNNLFSDGGVMQCPIRDCTNPVALVTGINQVYTNAQPFGIAVDSLNVYFYVSGSDTAGDFNPSSLQLKACAVGGCGGMPRVLGGAPPNLQPYGLAAASGKVIWGTDPIEACSASLGCADPTNAPVITLALEAGNFPAAVATDGRDVYWGVNPEVNAAPGIVRCALGGCGENPTTVCSEPAGSWAAPLALALDAANVYWTDNQGGVWRCSRKGTSGAATALAAGRQGALAIATDGIDVYWTEGGTFPIEVPYDRPGGVFKCAVNGCGGNPTTVASDQGVPMGIAVDATSVYWTQFSGGRITRWVK
jgi:hypothetical protein